MNIHQKINARSWFPGDIHPVALMNAGIQDGKHVVTPTRIRIHAPYRIALLGFAAPRFKQQFYLTESI